MYWLRILPYISLIRITNADYGDVLGISKPPISPLTCNKISTLMIANRMIHYDPYCVINFYCVYKFIYYSPWKIWLLICFSLSLLRFINILKNFISRKFMISSRISLVFKIIFNIMNIEFPITINSRKMLWMIYTLRKMLLMIYTFEDEKNLGLRILWSTHFILCYILT